MMPGMKRTGITYGFASTIFSLVFLRGQRRGAVLITALVDATRNEHGIGFGHSLRYE
jgi:hypothetical protein